MKFDFAIMNPPYGRIGNEITKRIIYDIEYDTFVNLMPSNDWRRYNKKDKLYQFVDTNSIKVVRAGFKNAAVTTMMCKVNKERSVYLSEAEFEIENYTDKSLKKYFYETWRRSHYAIDTKFTQVKCDDLRKMNPETTFIIGHRDISHGHLPYSKEADTYKWNVKKSIDAEYMIREHAEHLYGKETGMIKYNTFTFKTAKEKKNFTDFVYSDEGFRFMTRVFLGVNADGYIQEGKVFPKVSWSKSQTVQSILKDYGYTSTEIQEVMDDLKNFRSMDNE